MNVFNMEDDAYMRGLDVNQLNSYILSNFLEQFRTEFESAKGKDGQVSKEEILQVSLDE